MDGKPGRDGSWFSDLVNGIVGNLFREPTVESEIHRVDRPKTLPLVVVLVRVVFAASYLLVSVVGPFSAPRLAASAGYLLLALVAAAKKDYLDQRSARSQWVVAADIAFATVFFVLSGDAASLLPLLYCLPISIAILKFRLWRLYANLAVVLVCYGASLYYLQRVAVDAARFQTDTQACHVGVLTSFLLVFFPYVGFRYFRASFIGYRAVRRLLDGMSSGFAVLTPDRQITMLNRTMREWFAHRERHFAEKGVSSPTGEPFRDIRCYHFYNSEDQKAPCSYCPGKEVEEDPETRSATAVTVSPDERGHYIPYLLSVGAVRDRKTNELLGFVESVVHLMSVIEKLPFFGNLGLAVLGRDKTVHYVNEVKRRSTPWEIELGKPCKEAFNHSNQECEDCPVEECIKENKPHSGLTRSPDPSGHTRHAIVSCSPIEGPEDEACAVIEIVTDITYLAKLHEMSVELFEAPLAEPALLERAASLFIEMLKAQRCQIFKLDRETKALTLRSEVRFQRDETPGQGGRFRYVPDGIGSRVKREEDRRLLEAVFAPPAADGDDRLELQVLDIEDGSATLGTAERRYRYGRRLVVPLVAAGAPWGVATIEMSEKAAPRDQDPEASAPPFQPFWLAEKTAARIGGEIVGMALARREQAAREAVLWAARGIVHGMRADVVNANVSVGFTAESLEQLAPNAPEPLRVELQGRAQRLKWIGHSLSRIEAFLKNLHDFAEAAPPQLESVDIQAFLGELISEFTPFAEARSIGLEAHLDQRIICRIDPKLVHQALANMINNAFEALQPSTQKERRVEVSLFRDQRDPRKAKIRILDNGPPIPPHLRDRLFALLFTTKQAPAGLGLTIARFNIEAMGGEIDLVRDAPGTAFEVTLPCEAEEVANGESAPYH